MKCPNCGANLTIDDEVCSFCGNASPFAAKHRREMRRFTSDFNRTKSDVLKKSRLQSKWTAKITLIAVMIALNFIVWFLNMNFYEVERFINNRQIEANYFVHKTKLDAFEAERDFIGFAEYFNEHGMYSCDLMDEYRAVYDVSNNLTTVYRYIMQIVTEEETEYYTNERKIEYVAEQMDYIYRYSVADDYSDPDRYKPVHQECMDDLVQLMEDMVQTYLNVSDEDIAAFPELSKARRQIIIEEGLGINE